MQYNHYNNIPDQIKEQSHWVVWGVKGAPLKTPYNPIRLLFGYPKPAIAGVEGTWGTLQSALQCVSRGLAKGIGYEFMKSENGLYGVDLDHVFDENGKLIPEAQNIVDKLASYTEISPSGKGLHILIKAFDVSVTRHRKKGGFLEIYNDRRYFTITGNVYGNFKNIQTCSKELQHIHDTLLLSDKEQKTYYYQPIFNVTTNEMMFLEVGLKKDSILYACWMGERRFGDESSSDQALMNKLAYWCNANHPAMIQAFLTSPYYAQKDDIHKKKCQRNDYLPNTAKCACASLRSTAYEDNLRWKQQQVKNNRSFAR